MVLVTGASGFLGSHLVRYLAGRGVALRALYHSRQPDDELAALQGVAWMKADLLDVDEVENVMAGATHVYHCAAIVSFDPRERDKMIHFNVESTAHVVNEALVQHIEKLVFVSSIAALGNPLAHKKEIDENVDWSDSKFSSAYGLSKYLSETEVWRGIGEGLNAVVVNPGIILGAGYRPGPLANLVKLVGNGFPFYPDGVTGWVDVADVVEAMVCLMDADISDERFIISAGDVSYREVMGKLARALQKKPAAMHVSRSLATVVRVADGMRSKLRGTAPILTQETVYNAYTAAHYDNSKLLTMLPGFRYRNIDEAIRQVVG